MTKLKKKKIAFKRKSNRTNIFPWKYLLIAFFIAGFTFSVYYKEEVKIVYYKIKATYINYKKRYASKTEQSKKDKIIKHYEDNIFGIDVSHYQGIINWKQVQFLEDSIPIYFAIMRATAGDTKNDKYFKYNWREAKNRNIKRGAYHYYRPNENSTKQAENFIDRVKLEKGDIVPILDIEEEPVIQSIASLRKGIKNWLQIVEKEYGVKPIIYTGDSFYKDYLKGKGFEDYSFWIANYNKNRLKPKMNKWLIWQFSDQGKVAGINTFVDLNVFDGNAKHFEFLLVK